MVGYELILLNRLKIFDVLSSENFFFYPFNRVNASLSFNPGRIVYIRFAFLHWDHYFNFISERQLQKPFWFFKLFLSLLELKTRSSCTKFRLWGGSVNWIWIEFRVWWLSCVLIWLMFLISWLDVLLFIRFISFKCLWSVRWFWFRRGRRACECHDNLIDFEGFLGRLDCFLSELRLFELNCCGCFIEFIVRRNWAIPWREELTKLSNVVEVLRDVENENLTWRLSHDCCRWGTRHHSWIDWPCKFWMRWRRSCSLEHLSRT